MPYDLNWKIEPPPFPSLGSSLSRRVRDIVAKQVPDLADMFPLRHSWDIAGFEGDGWLAFRLKDRTGMTIPMVDNLKGTELADLQAKVLPFRLLGPDELWTLLGDDWINFNTFTYVGPYRDRHGSWQHVQEHLLAWLNHVVTPEVFGRNQTRVLRALPPAPAFNASAILAAMWVLESEAEVVQGTGFSLDGVGVVTCAHVIAREMHAFKATALAERYPVTVSAKNDRIDLAIVSIPRDLGPSLRRGSANELKQMDRLAIAGFPNYRYGDTGVLIPGLVAGFRPVSGVRRILTDAPIVSGNSGGPAIGANNEVIGIAVTGAERPDLAQRTENHGIIPVDALDLLDA